MSSHPKTCPVQGCTCPIFEGRLMCRHHWFRVPKADRDTIWKLYKASRKSDATADGMHRRACFDAIKGVNLLVLQEECA